MHNLQHVNLQHVQFATCTIYITCNFQHVQFVTDTIYYICNLQHTQFATRQFAARAICNTCNLEHMQFATGAICNMWNNAPISTIKVKSVSRVVPHLRGLSSEYPVIPLVYWKGDALPWQRSSRTLKTLSNFKGFTVERFLLLFWHIFLFTFKIFLK